MVMLEVSCVYGIADCEDFLYDLRCSDLNEPLCRPWNGSEIENEYQTDKTLFFGNAKSLPEGANATKQYFLDGNRTFLRHGVKSGLYGRLCSLNGQMGFREMGTDFCVFC